MSDTIIRVEGLGKKYLIGHQANGDRNLREVLADSLSLRGFRNSQFAIRTRQFEPFWALRNVSFEVARGEVVGIIGRNGAGKSTLLKILSRITEPTTGRVRIRGRVASLLEVGTGFHPELTGRENVFLNGAILGMSRKEIKRKFDEIVAFAEVEKFLDTPVKRYSSGMYVRLAFAVAAHLEPEILIVDEVLAVGDASFQRKCLGKIGEVAGEGRTVLFVSHSMTAIQALCKRVLWLSEGEVVKDAEAGRVVSDYLTRGTSASAEKVWNNPATAPGNDRVRLHSARVHPVDGTATDHITIRTPFVMEFEYWNLCPDSRLSLSLHLYNEQGLTVLYTFPIREPVWHGRPFPAGLFRSVCYVPGDLLNDGTHRVSLFVVKDQAEVIFSLRDVVVFEVLESLERRGDWHGKWVGAVRPNLKWETTCIKQDL